MSSSWVLVTDGTPRARARLKGFSANALLKRVAAVGPQNIRNEQRVKRLENNLYEFKSHQVRIFWTYGTSIGTRRTVVLLDGVVKKQNKHKPQDMNRARQHIARRQKEGKS